MVTSVLARDTLALMAGELVRAAGPAICGRIILMNLIWKNKQTSESKQTNKQTKKQRRMLFMSCVSV